MDIPRNPQSNFFAGPVRVLPVRPVLLTRLVLQTHPAFLVLPVRPAAPALPAPLPEAPLVAAAVPGLYCIQSTLKLQETLWLQIIQLISSYAFTSFLFVETLPFQGFR
jgi:hypothetical protein